MRQLPEPLLILQKVPGMNNYQLAIEEMALSGSIAIPGSASTVYRWARIINGILERGKYDCASKPMPRPAC